MICEDGAGAAERVTERQQEERMLRTNAKVLVPRARLNKHTAVVTVYRGSNTDTAHM